MTTLRRAFPKPDKGLVAQATENSVDTSEVSKGFPNSSNQRDGTNNQQDGSGNNIVNVAAGTSSKSSDDSDNWDNVLIGFGLTFIALILIAAGFYIGFVIFGNGPDDLEKAPPPTIVEGGACKNWNDYQNKELCDEADRVELAFSLSRYWLRRGDASMAVDHHENANENWRLASEIGRSVGAPEANMASERLAYLELNCPTTPTSLRRLFEPPSESGLLEARQVTIADRKHALKVLGFYQGVIDNEPDWPMREAVLKFQSTLWFSPSGALRPEQVTLLICGAAQRGLDREMQDLLGVMFATGQGVAQNTDSALFWFGKSAEQGDRDAHFHLALMYGTGFVRSANGTCGSTGTLQRADNYLKLAAQLEHPRALSYIERLGISPGTAKARWSQIQTEVMAGATTPAADNCR